MSTGTTAEGSAAPHTADARTHSRDRRRTREGSLRRLLAAADVAAIAAALTMAVATRGHVSGAFLGWSVLVLPAWIVLFKLYGLYDRDAKRVSHSTVDDIPWIFHALVIGAIGLWIYYRVLPTPDMTPREAFTFFAFAFVAVPTARALARTLARALLQPDRVLFLGGGPLSHLLIEKIRAHPEYALQPIGYVDADGVASVDLADEIVRLGTIHDLILICETAGVDRLVVAAPAVDDIALVDLIRETKDLDLKISILPHVVDVLGPAVEVDDVEGVTVLGLNPAVLNRSSRFLKRSMDVVVSLVLLVLLAPVLIVTAVAIRLTSAGPAIFAQERVGREGRTFRCYKFRTMVADAERRAAGLRAQSSHSAWLLLEHDPRITPFGRILRQASLDELPQLWNVLRGDMSLVGPRPLPIDVDEKISGWGRRRLDLTPGITGLW